MSKLKYAVGDKFKSANNRVHEVLGAIEARDGGLYYWVDDDGDRDPRTVGESTVDAWREITPFFEEGVTYAWRSAVESSTVYDTWKILKIYELNGERYIWALFTHANGHAYTTPMSTNNYSRMEEVARDPQ